MASALGETFDLVTFVRFVDFTEKGNRLTIAVCWSESDEDVRQAIYDRAPECVEASGWYPLPQGERLKSVLQSKDLDAGPGLPWLGTSRLASISAAGSGADAGTALRVGLTDGHAILLDSGFGREEVPPSGERLVLLSHHHRDHAGGIERGQFAGVPAAISRGGALALDAEGRLDPIRRMNSVTAVQPGTSYRVGERITVTPFVVPHMPGAVGYELDDGERSLVYTGDIVVKSARHDWTPRLLERVRRDRLSTVLVDATMAGRPQGASLETPASEVMRELEERDVCVVAHDDHLLYSYLDLFHRVKDGPERGSVHFVVTRRLQPMFRVLHDAFIRRDLDQVDPLITAQYGTSMSAWGESRWLYWLPSAGAQPQQRRIWFLTPSDLDAVSLPDDLAIVTVGRANAAGRGGVLDIDSTPWTGHSDERSLADTVSALELAGAQVLLFHNFTKRLVKFARTHRLGARPVSTEPFVL